MKKIPQSCQRCGAPITWDEVSSSITCEFCGGKTYIRSKFVLIQRVKDSAYKTLAPVGKIINNAGIALLEKQNQEKLRNLAMKKGVTLIAPETIFLSNDTKFGKNIIIWEKATII